MNKINSILIGVKKKGKFPIRSFIALILLLAIMDMPIWYYQIERIIICICAVVLIMKHVKSIGWKGTSPFVYLGVIMLFNPFQQMNFSHQIWHVIDIVFMAFLAYSYYEIKLLFAVIKEENKLKRYEDGISDYLSDLEVQAYGETFRISDIDKSSTRKEQVNYIKKQYYEEIFQKEAKFYSIININFWLSFLKNIFAGLFITASIGGFLFIGIWFLLDYINIKVNESEMGFIFLYFSLALILVVSLIRASSKSSKVNKLNEGKKKVPSLYDFLEEHNKKYPIWKNEYMKVKEEIMR